MTTKASDVLGYIGALQEVEASPETSFHSGGGQKSPSLKLVGISLCRMSSTRFQCDGGLVEVPEDVAETLVHWD